MLRDLRVTLEMIKWEHSVFALPFALCGAMLAAGVQQASASYGFDVKPRWPLEALAGA